MSSLDDKVEAQVQAEAEPQLNDFNGEDAKLVSEKLGTVADQRDMYRMGKAQKLRVSQTSRLRVFD